jgi:hypothetical protein
MGAFAKALFLLLRLGYVEVSHGRGSPSMPMTSLSVGRQHCGVVARGAFPHAINTDQDNIILATADYPYQLHGGLHVLRDLT